MRDQLVRFGVAIEGSLLRQLDALAEERDCTRSELLRDLARAEVGRAKVPKGVEAIGALTLVYDHHVRDLNRKLTDLQHELGDGVRSTLHVHLSHDLCLEVVVMQGQANELQRIADRILAMRGVKQGGIELVAGLAVHGYHAHPHTHAAERIGEDGSGPATPSVRIRGTRPASPVKSDKLVSRRAPPRRGRTPPE